MGRRSEQRIAISFSVIIRGTDSRGVPFVVTTETADISCTGASLKGLEGVVEPGRKVEIEAQNQKAWYRVQWVGIHGRSKEWRVGVRCLEPGKYIWGIPPLSWKPDAYDPAAPEPVETISTPPRAPSSAVPQKERRKFARYPCRLETRVTTQGACDGVALDGKIADISLGGCYIEMLAPLPEESQIEISLSPEGQTMRLFGRVCSSQAGFGMGVAFTGMSPEDYERLRRFAPPMTSPAKRLAPQPAPAMSAPARPAPQPPRAAETLDAWDLPPASTALEALVHLLLRKGILTRAELLEELEKHKAAHT